MARLLSVNVGLPRDIAWQGKTVRTAIWKAPVQGRRMVRRFNIDGDGQGDLVGHGGEHRAVFVYQIDSYRYWQSQFGEATSAMAVRGELYRRGSARQRGLHRRTIPDGRRSVQVTQTACHLLSDRHRMNEPQMAALLVAHGRPGFYFRVLEEGEVEAGVEIVRVAAGPERITVAELSALLYLPDHPKSRLEQALRIPALSAGWRTSFEALLERARSGGAMTGNPGLAPAAGPPPAGRDFARCV